ncbi:DPOLM-like protein [Mya arenaria]|uniref:DPOLM-like protein n=1 Tax=Mya arenaria TaxID=6604 RepID=A0ABY7FI18_MYAAR|nr:DPOLM-like protein [Mya arenaria]
MADNYDNRTAVLHIIDARIQKQRVEDMKSAAKKRHIVVHDSFSDDVTHIITEYSDLEGVARILGVDVAGLLRNRVVVNVKWFSECMRAGHVIEVQDVHTVKPATQPQQTVEERDSRAASIPGYACQRITPLNHHNTRFTVALETLEKYADLRYDDNQQDYSRALAFRRASCVLKSLPGPLTNLQQLRNEILEDGVCEEVFTSIFGIGPSKAKEFISRGWSTVEDVKNGYTSADWRVLWGLCFHDDLVTPVTLKEARYISALVKRHLDAVLPGAIMEVTGGFRRGKPMGHDVDILISHPAENKIIGALPRLLHRLGTSDVVLCGKHENSSYRDDVLTTNSKLSPRGQLDHFEKWIGMIKVPNKVRGEQGVNDTSGENGAKSTSGQECDMKKCNNGKKTESQNVQIETVLYERTADNENDYSVNPTSNQKETDLEVQETTTGNNLDGSIKESLDYSDDNKTQDPKEVLRTRGDWIARRVDLIIAPYSQYYYALVGWTGSKQFNRDARTYADRELKMKLTSHGLYDLNQGRKIPASSEKEVFDNLKLPFREPIDRNC